MNSLTKAFKGLNVSREKKDSKIDTKMFGYYHCKDCNRHWQSANSWKDYGQKCQSCGKIIMAYHREEFLKNEENKIDLKKPHPKHLCQKCQIYGDCTIRISDISNRNKRKYNLYSRGEDNSSESYSDHDDDYYYDDDDYYYYDDDDDYYYDDDDYYYDDDD
ncbi:hypothetical protein SteCoe_739 [Stentor coeruleus]|uniref:3CxxC-type domain-containing protein n=1 Tax=Stentor coeruleus TaxID=5963 RepID=A0A1R2D3P8_9CILI|nr:hypothetical protein SteCoe_739 [Stentor coeruleus]